MKTTKSIVKERNRWLKQQFQDLGLALGPVWEPAPEDLSRENAVLADLLDWVTTYRQDPDRARLEARGYRYPPIEPDIDPDSDWLRFERWVRGEPLDWNYVREFGPLPDPAELNDDHLTLVLDELLERLFAKGVCVHLEEEVPDRLAYSWLRSELITANFEVTGPDTHCHIGCPAHCPSCFQRPWCELGQELGWVEDDRAGRMVLPPVAESYRRASG